MKVVLGVTHNCNLACTYCYAGRPRRRAMTLDTGYRAVDFGFEISAPSEMLEFGFFGGEPLLCPQLISALSRYIHARARASSRPVKLSVTTNGTILTPAILQMLRDERIRLCVSLDGTRAVHDRYRRRRDGGPTYDRIVRNLRLAMDVLDDVQVNAVFSPATIDQLAAGVASILELGVAVVHVNPDICAAWTDEAAHAARQQFADIARLYIDSFAAGKEIGINIIDSKVIVLLKGGYSPLDRCGMARTQWAVAPGGNLYPCERFIGDDRDSPFCLGNVHTGLDMERQSRIRRGVGNRNPECAACPLGPYCMNWCGCTNFYLSGATDRTGRAQCIFERAAIAAARTVLTELSVSGNELFIDHFMGYLNHQRLPAVVGNL